MLERGGIQHSKLLIIVDGSKIKALGPLDLEKKKKKKIEHENSQDLGNAWIGSWQP